MRTWLGRVNKDFYGGGLILLIGLVVTYEGIGYRVGTLRDMGPGFFPTSLGIILAVIGALIALLGSTRLVEGEGDRRGIDKRGWAAILASIVAFIVLGQYGGLVPATFAVVFISALGDRANTLIGALVLSLAMVVVCVLLFWWALQLDMPLFTWGGS